MNNKNYWKVKEILSSISASICGRPVRFKLGTFDKYKDDNGESMMYIQVFYDAECTKTGEIETWKGRKWRLSEYFLKQEIIGTAKLAVEIAERHEHMENFKVNNIILFNPHVNFDRLLEISGDEMTRELRDQKLEHNGSTR